MKTKVAIVGSGNIGTDLMIKIMEMSETLEMGALVGIDPDSDGLARAGKLGIATTHEGLEGLTKMDEWSDIRIVFDATSAGAHRFNSDICARDGKTIIDLTPAAIGPYATAPARASGDPSIPARSSMSDGISCAFPTVGSPGRSIATRAGCRCSGTCRKVRAATRCPRAVASRTWRSLPTAR